MVYFVDWWYVQLIVEEVRVGCVDGEDEVRTCGGEHHRNRYDCRT